MKRVFKGVLVLVLLAAVSFGVFAGGQQEAVPGVTEDSIKIGTFQAMSGPVASIGVPVANGLEAYFNHVNANGGVYGRSIDLIVADDQFNPEKLPLRLRD